MNKKLVFFLSLLISIISIKGYATTSTSAASATICKNYAATGLSPQWTTLGTMKITEGNTKDLGNVTGSWTVTLILAAPTGWQFNTAVSPTLGFTAARNVTAVTKGTFTSTSLTVIITGTNRTLKDVITIAGLQVQATSTSSVAGNIKPSSISGVLTGVTTSTNFGTLTPLSASAGTASVSIAASPSSTICSGTNVTFTATPTNGGTAPKYQWKLNGSNITGATNATYSSTTLANGNTIVCALVSNSCITSPTATSGTITMAVTTTPNINNFSSQTATSPCIGSSVSVTVNSGTLGSGTFNVTYRLTGSNTGTYTDVLTMGSTTGTFPVSYLVLDTPGSVTVTTTTITNSGCNSTVPDSNVATISVNALPTAVTASGGGTYCGSTTITGANGGSGTIYFQGTTSGGTSTSTPSTSQSVSSSGTYYFRAQSSAGCWGTEGSVTVAINPLPTAVTVIGSGTYCASATITASNGGSGTIYYEGTTSNGTSTATPSTSQLVTSSGSYYFRAESSAGCWGIEDTAVVTINPNPASITGTPTVCSGSTTSLTDATSIGKWSSSTTTVATVGSTSGIVTGVATGTTTISYILGTGCNTTSTVTVSTTPATISGSSAECSGSTTTWTNSTLYGVWTSGNTAIATVGSVSGAVTAVANGTSAITYSTGCGSAATKTITVTNSPILGTFAVCSGSTTALSNASLGGAWSSGSTSIATVGSGTGIVTGVSGGTATISYVNGACTATAIVTVNVTPASVNGTASVCAGLTTTLSDATPFGTWSSGSTGLATVGSTGIVSGVSFGTATITYSTGCGTAATKIVTVNPLPSAISGTYGVCTGSTTALTDAGGGTWISSNTSLATIGSGSGVVTGISSGTPTVTYTLSTGCLITAPVTVNPLPSSISGTTHACVASTTTLSDAGSGTWSSSNTSLATVGSATGLVTGVSAGTPSITYSLNTGCLVKTTVTINPLPSAIAGTTSVCVGSTTTLSDAGGGTWASSNTFKASIGTTSGVVTGVAAGVVTITYTLGTGCQVTTPATVNSLPASIAGTAVVCAGSTTTLSDAGGGTWTSSNTTVATIGSASGTATGVLAGTVNITYTLTTGCTNSATLTVNPLPDAGTISGTTTFCEGDGTTFTDGSPDGIWTSNDTTIASIDSMTGDIFGEGGGTTTITYSVTNSCGNDYATIAVTVNPLPDADTIAGTNTVCAGSTLVLSDIITGGVWSSTVTTVATIGSTGIVTGVSSGTSMISYTVTNGCGTDFDTLTVFVNPLPSAISGTAAVCVGNTTTLSDGGGGTWTSSNTSLATIGSSTGVLTGVSTGTPTITYTLSTGCLVSKTATVNPVPTTISGASAVCAGSSVTLTDATGGGTWSSSSTGVATIGSGTGTVSGIASGTTTITYKLSTGCLNTTVLTVNPLPSAITGTKNVCVASITTLSDAGGGTWMSGNTALATIGSSSGVLTGVSAGTPTITYTLGTGCIATALATINPIPATINGTTAVCAGATTTLTDATSGGAWTSSNTSVATVGSGSGIVTPVTTGTVTISYSLSTGCNATSPVTVNVKPILSSASNSGPICAGGTLTLTANSPSNVTAYVWSGPVAITNSTTSSASVPAATTSAAGTYSVTVNNGAGPGCVNTYTTTATVNTTPTAAPTNSGIICNGGTVTLTANPSGGASVYSWSGPNLSSSTAQNPTATPTVTVTYSLTVTDGTGRPGCSPATVYTTSVTVNTKPTAAPTNSSPICIGGTVTLTANPTGASVYAWSGPNLSSNTAQNPTATPTVTATYSLTVTDGSGRSGCSPATVYTTSVTVNSIPNAAPTNNGPVCSGSTVTLTANPGGSTNTYTWSGSNLSSTTAQNPTATPTVTATYSLTVSYGTGHSGCNPATVYTTTVTVNASGKWLGGTSSDWGTSGNWCGGIPSSTTNVLVPSGATYYPLISTGTATVNNLTIQSSATLNLSGGTLQIAGTISNSGTFADTAGTIEMNGSSAQTIPAGTFSGNTVRNLTINNSSGVTLGGTLSISGILKATSGNFHSAGYLTLLSTATKTSLVDGSGSGTISDTVTMQRYLTSGFGYRYISSPFVAAKVKGLSSYIVLNDSFPNLYKYDESLASTGWVIDTIPDSILYPLHGYSSNFGITTTSKTISLRGIVNNGTVSSTLYNHNNTYTLGYNLVGNPYPSPIDWDASSGWTKTNIDNAVYYYNPGNTDRYSGTYGSYISGISSDGIANNIIPAMQGFFIHVSNGTFPVTGTLGMTNSVRITNTAPVYHKTSSSNPPLLRLTASFVNDVTDGTVIYFDNNATAEFDETRDALKLLNTDISVPSLYSVSQDAKTQYSIMASPTPGDSDINVVPLGIVTGKDGQIIFNAANIQDIPAGMHIYFNDAKTQVVQDLQLNPKYSKFLGAGTYENRFFLMFTFKEKAAIPAFSDELNAYTTGNDLFVYLTYGNGNLVITNMLGQVVLQQEISGYGYHEVHLPFASGVYVATLFSNMGKQSKKIVLENK